MATYLLDQDVIFLNHGSFGATPQELLAVQEDLRKTLEREPIDFLVRQLPARIDGARSAVAQFIGSDPAGTVFVQNTTGGVNAVLGSLTLQAGDEILTTNHRYDAVRFTLERAVSRQGAHVTEAEVPFPLQSADQVVAAIASAFTDRTRLLIVDHITSTTALIFPVAALVALARERGVPILVDGAHAPGQLDLDIQALGADFWVGNLHKWLCAPKGAAVLCVSEQWRDRIQPTVTSHGYGQGLHGEFDWCGTFDPTAWLTAPAAIALHQEQGGASFRAAHHALVQQGRVLVADALGVELPHPDDPSLYGSMATIPLPCDAEETMDLWNAIRHEDGIEVPLLPWDGRAWVRISGFAGYNLPAHYATLASCLAKRLGP